MIKIPPNISAKLYHEGKYLLRDAGHQLGLYNNFYRSARGSRIMIYHGICKQQHTRFNPIFLTQKTFENHLKFYKKHFNVISLDDYYQQKFSNDRFNISLTFDDGFANNYKYVLPLLHKYQVPATFFVTAIREAGYDILWNDFLNIVSKYGPDNLIYKNRFYYHKNQFGNYASVKSGITLAERLRDRGFTEKAEMMKLLYPSAPFKTNKQEEDYWLQMSTRQIRELAASPYATVGAHGYYHNDLSRIRISDAAEELILSKQYLEKVTRKKIKSVAFPYGAYTPEVIEAAKGAGYRQLLAMDFNSTGDHSDDMMRERFTVNPFISTYNQMYATINRRYENH
jgi:peptidoglycan/xylan/chitin deacetylase (PgdA/CDA1 family)